MFVFPGFNSNIEHRSNKYHVQTEVNTVDGANRINTLVYLSGRIYLSASFELSREDSINRETAAAVIRRQHNKIIRDLISDQLEPQKTVKEKEAVDFFGMYGSEKIFSCYEKHLRNPLETFKKLLISLEEET